LVIGTLYTIYIELKIFIYNESCHWLDNGVFVTVQYDSKWWTRKKACIIINVFMSNEVVSNYGGELIIKKLKYLFGISGICLTNTLDYFNLIGVPFFCQNTIRQNAILCFNQEPAPIRRPSSNKYYFWYVIYCLATIS